MRPLLISASPIFKIAYLFLFLLIGIFIAGIFAGLILMIPGINEYGEISGIYVNTIVQSVFAIALPAYLIVAWTNHKPVYYLKIINDGKLPWMKDLPERKIRLVRLGDLVKEVNKKAEN